MPSLQNLISLSALTLISAVGALNACTGTDTIFTGKEGVRYRICPDTDLTGTSLQVTRDVASVTVCAQLCDTNMSCFKAVYDTQTKECHFKDSVGLNWVDNDRFDTIQAEQVNIAQCPYDETAYKSNEVSPLA